MDAAPSKPMPGKAGFGLAAGVFLAALALRVHGIGQESFYIDEVVTLRSLDSPLWKHVREVETSPPLYFAIIRVWAELFGRSHESLRLFSALSGAVGVALVHIAALRMGLSRAVGAAVALVCACSPLALWHAQQARHYGLLFAASAAYLACLAAAVEKSRTRDWVVVSIMAAVGFSIHYYFAFLVAGVIPAAWALRMSEGRNRLCGFVAAHATSGLASLAYLPLFLHQSSLGHTSYIPVPAVGELWSAFVVTCVVGPFNTTTALVAGAHGVLIIAIPLIVLLAWQRGGSPGAPNACPAGFWPAALLGTVLGSVAVPFAASHVLDPIFLRDRYTVVALPPYILLVAWSLEHGFALLRDSWRIIAAPVLVILFVPAGGAAILNYKARLQDFDWRGAVRVIDSEWRSGDALMFLPTWQVESYRVNGGTRSSLPAPVHPVSLTPEVQRFWIVGWEQDPSERNQDILSVSKSMPGARARVQSPHLALWEVPVPPQP